MQQSHGRNNALTLFGIENIPSDNQIRKLLDPIVPSTFYPLFSATFEELENCGHLKGYRFWDGYILLPIDGRAVKFYTSFFKSSLTLLAK